MSPLAAAGPDPLLAGLALLITALAGAVATIYAARRTAPPPPPPAVLPASLPGSLVIPPVPSPDAAEVWVNAFMAVEHANQRATTAEARVVELEHQLAAKDRDLDSCNTERLSLLRRLADGH